MIDTMKPDSQPKDEASTPDANGRSAAESPQCNNSAADNSAFIEQLKQRLEETRLPADLREQILANLPPPEERERLFRELKENGGLSSEEFFASLGLEVERQP
jgi:hypothetical protein